MEQVQWDIAYAKGQTWRAFIQCLATPGDGYTLASRGHDCLYKLAFGALMAFITL